MQKLLVILLLMACAAGDAQPYSVVIDEIMADPSPQVGLPAHEWIELKNISALPVNLQNWRIGDRGGQSGPLPLFMLQPDSFVIVCSSSAVGSLQLYGNVLAVTSFPSLDNDNDQLFVKSEAGATIHAVNYSSGWYKNELKKNGGWTLEMIDTKKPCIGFDNWQASRAAIGGSPGKKNTVDSILNDTLSPRVLRSYTSSDHTIIILFSEPVDSLSASLNAEYAVSDGVIVIKSEAVAPLFDQVRLTTSAPMKKGIVYTVTINHVTDCQQNVIKPGARVRTGIPEDPGRAELIINEILFDPLPGGTDYLEYYNNGRKIVDASTLFVANRNTSGVIGAIQQISSSPHYLFPGDYLLLTEDTSIIIAGYKTTDLPALLQVSSLPSMPDDTGNPVLLNAQGMVVDELRYQHDWHFKLLNNKEGIALERVNPDHSSNDKNNWHSAASIAGYGTPGYLNSQYRLQNDSISGFTVMPKLISPDNDGHDDLAIIKYAGGPGKIVTIIVFDNHGRPVRHLARNAIAGADNQWTWDGLGEKGEALAMGIYIVWAEIFDLQGGRIVFKKVVAIAYGR